MHGQTDRRHKTGEISVLNVGAGDIKLSFNSSDVGEVIRARRMVKDMLRRGYALLVEVERGGEKRFERALDFDETRGQYIIVDFDPVQESDNLDQAWDQEVLQGEKHVESQDAPPEVAKPGPAPAKSPAYTGDKRCLSNQQRRELGLPERHGPGRKAIPAGATRAVAVGRSAGG